MDGYQLPSFDTAPLKPTASPNTNNAFRGFDSFAIDAPPKDVVSPPASSPKPSGDELPSYGQASGGTNNQAQPSFSPFAAQFHPQHQPTAEAKPQDIRPASSGGSPQPSLYQLPTYNSQPSTPSYQQLGQFLQPQSQLAQPQAQLPQQSAPTQQAQQPAAPQQLPQQSPLPQQTQAFQPMQQASFQPTTSMQQASFQPPQQHNPVPQQMYGYPSSAPESSQRDPVKALLEAYPNPHTEYEKLRLGLETLSAQFQMHFKRMEMFTESVDQRLAGLESAMKELNATKSKSSSSSSSSLYPAEPSKARPSSPRYGSPGKLKKKKKTRTISAYETDSKGTPAPAIAESAENDEELARKLQRQFNAEAEAILSAPKTDSSAALSDEEYARKLQSLYLKRDMRATKKKASETKAKTDDKKKPEEKAASSSSSSSSSSSLWSRLFGAADGSQGKDDDDDDEDTELKSMPKSAPATATKGTAYPTLPTTASPLQPLPIAPQYGFYPQQPYMLGAQYTPYVPMQTPGYVLPQQPQQHN